jgi:hypothetical protein
MKLGAKIFNEVIIFSGSRKKPEYMYRSQLVDAERAPDNLKTTLNFYLMIGPYTMAATQDKVRFFK